VVIKQLCYIPITKMVHLLPQSGDQTTLLHTYHAKIERLFMCEEMTQQMRWHKEGICDSEDADIMSHHADAEA
jgi:hypothetical protein